MSSNNKKISHGKLQSNYSSYEEFKSFSMIYNLHKRLGYKSPLSAWEHNPHIQWSTNPSDFKKFKK